ncbi:protein dead ringer isoform X2 [Onthophagus taurus]|uniref:protein dead ringer isoform X2 n=1 Tax=Onthophagus taurus TaxID=166361 RepID=UPI000C20CE19|nr:protein dead ringer-like isoform X2 [Onthophagus taurus]
MEMDNAERDGDIGGSDDNPFHPRWPQHILDTYRKKTLANGVSIHDTTAQGSDEDDSNEHEHGDVLAKLKMQVRDIKVAEDFEGNRQQYPLPCSRETFNFQMAPHLSMMPQPQYLVPQAAHQNNPGPSSSSPHSSEGSSSSNNNSWSFEEQFKQVNGFLPKQQQQQRLDDRINSILDNLDGSEMADVEYSSPIPKTPKRKRKKTEINEFKEMKQLYELSDDPKRKEFLDELFAFMHKRGSPINRLPIMAKQVLDLYELYNLVIARGGLVDVINKKLWQEIIKGLHLPSSITSAAFTLRTQYMKYLYAFECEKRQFSTADELQTAIDGNRREGRRGSYVNYNRPSNRSPNHQQQMSPISMNIHQQQQLAAARMSLGLHNGPHHIAHQSPPLVPQLNGNPLHPMNNSVTMEFQHRMLEYIRNVAAASSTTNTPNTHGNNVVVPTTTALTNGAPLNPIAGPSGIDLSKWWSYYNNNNNNQSAGNNNQQQTQPPPPSQGVVPAVLAEPQREALNLSATPEPDENNHQSTGGNGSGPSIIEPIPGTSGGGKEEDGDDGHDPDEDFQPRKFIKMENGAPVPVLPISTSISIQSRGDGRNGDNSLVVTMQIAGVAYEGVLFAQRPSGENSSTVS